MKATGIIRRIDDLGRVVIPKEIRRTMKIREGDAMEIYLDGGNRVIFEKYESGLNRFVDDLVDRVDDAEYSELSPEAVREIKAKLADISSIIKKEKEE